MPTILETDGIQFNLPDEWSLEQIQGFVTNRLPTIREGLKKGRAADLASRIPRDLAIAGSNVIQGAARGGQIAAEALVGPTRVPAEKPKTASEAKIASNIRQLALQSAMSAPEEGVRKVIGIAPEPSPMAAAAIREEALRINPLYRLGTESKEAAEDFYAVNPKLEDSIPAKLSAAASSTIPVIAAAPGGPVAMGATYAAMSGQQGAEEAIAEGRPDKADEAYLAYAGLGALSEAALGYPIALLRTIRAARRAGVPPKAFGEAAKKSFPQLAGRVAKESGKAAVREAVQESTEQFGQNIAARDVIGFDPDRERTQGVREAAIYGGAVGGLFGGGFGAAQAYDAQPKNQLDRLLKEYGLDLRQIDPQLADVAAREAMRPENAQRTVVPAMLDQPATGWAVGEDGTRLSELTLTQPEVPAPVPAPAPEAEPRRRRPIAPATEPPRFRPPIPNVPTPPEETPARPAPAPPPVAPPMAPSTEGAPAPAEENIANVGQMGPAIVGNLYQMMFDRLQSGKYPEKIKNPTADKIQSEHKRQPFQSPEEIGAWVNTGLDRYVRNARFATVTGEPSRSSGEKVNIGESTQVAGETPAPVTVPPSPPTTPVTQEVPSAVQVRENETLSSRETPEARPQVGAQVRPTETPQAPGEIALQPQPTSAGEEVTTEQAPSAPITQPDIKPTSPNASVGIQPNLIEVERKKGIDERIAQIRRLLQINSERMSRLEERNESEDYRGATFDKALELESRLEQELNVLEKQKLATKFSITLEQPAEPAVGLQDVLNAFPSEQGFAVQPSGIKWSDGEQSQGFLVRLPNGQAILIDPSRERIAFDAEKVAVDWGIDPKTVATARGSFLPNAAQIDGISVIGLIELLNTAGPSTLSHEKFHALFEMALTREDRKSILDRYKTEEKAAEAFRRSEGFTRGFWDKMRQFIERLANLFRGDAFAKLRAPLSPDFISEPIAQGKKFSIEEIYSNKENLEKFIQTPYISEEEAANLRQQAGARAALVPDQIADEIRGLNAADPIEKRMASLLEFVLRMHGLAPALEIQRILDDANIASDLKYAAISAVLRAIEHVRVQTTEVDDQLQQAMSNLARMTKAMRKISGKQLIEAKAKETAARLITGYRAYLTAQAATMPADQNVAAARQQVIRSLQATLNRDEKQSPDATMRALQAIAKRISELPVAQGPAAVIEAIRSKNILKGVVGDSTIDMLLDEKPGGIAPLLLNPQTNEMLVQLAELQKKAETYAKQIETVEQAFRGKGEVTPVELKRFAETYRKFRNKQIDAAKAIAEMDKDFKKADESVQVYTRTKDILERLQNDPLFKDQLEAVANIPGGHIFNDIMSADKETRIKIYTSPLKQVDENGKVTQNEYRVLLAPDRQADEQTMREMALLVHEIEEYLEGEVEPIERRTLTELRDYIRKYQLTPMFATTIPGWSFETGHGIIDLNPLSWVQVIAGGRARAPRSEMEKMTLRAADMANTAFRVGDQSLNGYRLNRNNREYGDEVTKIAILDAVKSHAWDSTRIDHWNEWVLNPILASGQAPGQMRLGVGDYIPGTGIKITKEDMAAARMQKRFSQAIVQTTQGTAQNLPPLLKDNPILIEDEFAGRKTLRAAFGTGPLTMARRFGEWARTFAHLWTNATAEGRRRLITDGRQFRLAVLGYVTTTNPEFEAKFGPELKPSPLKPIYEEYTSRARTNEDARVQSLDHLIDQLAEIAVSKGMFPDVATAFPQIEQTLLQEIDQVVKAFNAQVVEQGHEGNTPQEVVAIASAKNSFTTARHRMVAPDTFYDYTLTSANDRIAFTAGAYQMFQSKQISALQDLRKALDIDLGVLEQKIADLKATGVPQSRAYREVQKQTKLEQEKGERRFTYMRLLQHKRTIDKMVDDLSKLVIDVRDPNDAAALLALSRFQSTMSSSLLASPMAIANNFFGGGVAAAWVTQQNLGRARMLLPLKATANLVSTLPKRLLAAYGPKTAIGKLARSNMPMVRQMAQLLEQTIANEIYFNTEAESWGLRAPPDMRNRLKAAKELPGTAGQIIWGKTPLIGGVFNRLESIPILRQLLIRLRDVSPRVIDEVVNRSTVDIHRSETFGWLKLRAVQAFAAREEMAKKTGADISDFTKESNLLTPQELGLSKSSGYRDITRMRQLFELVGNLDLFLLDYYKRYKAAPEGEKAKVPLFTDPAAEGSVLFDMEAHGNIPTTGFTPPSMAGVGQSGVIKRLLFMFKNYILRMGAQIERLPEKDLRDPKGWREAYGFWSIFLALAVFLFSGLLATETGVPLTRVVTGRAPSRVTAANVMADPDIAIVARYAGMALANNFPYYGGVISEMLGNPGYGSWWDAANMVPAAGLVRDISIAAKRIGQTGDPVFPTLDFLGRWLPPASPAIRLYPGMEGDIQAKNVSRALRVVGPSEGMELAGGGGGSYAQTPVTPEIRRLIAAAYQGDEAGVKRAFDAAVAAKEELGSSDPVRAVKQSLAAAIPARRVFGRSITEAEEQQLVGQMSSGQRETYAGAQSAFDLINRTLGTNYRLTSAPPRSSTRTRRRRRLSGGRRLPSIRRSSRSRRSPFSRYRVRRLSGRRRRRSPSFSTSA